MVADVNRLESCELLSNFGYIGIGNNVAQFTIQQRLVVNCFQILAILGLVTTFLDDTYRIEQL